MHIPDGMLDTKTFTTLWFGGAGSVAYASRWVRRNFDSSKLVLMAVMAALVFGLQMLNFPIAIGTSGHFAGGAAVAIILGFWPAAIVMSAVLVVQAFLFGDGGITTLGANIVNLAIAAPCVGSLAYQLLAKIHPSLPTRLIAAFTAAFLSVVAAAALVAIELWASGRAPFYPALAAMASWHALIGIGEGAITASLIAYLAKVRPDLASDSLVLYGEKPTPLSPEAGNAKEALSPEAGSEVDRQAIPPSSPSSMRSVLVVFAVLALTAGALSFLASKQPDGLEYVYFESGLGKPFEDPSIGQSAPISDYLLPGVDNELLSGIGAGIIGVVTTGALMFTAATVIVKKRAG
ncbi:MAG: energy-coupling factor ABC transporter permease [Coriobacteriia bacterium]|nr:energy-coupling factor ABC transporter permease [Coriobacteriia bacterium]